MTPSALFSTKKKRKKLFFYPSCGTLSDDRFENARLGELKASRSLFSSIFLFFLVQNKNILLFFATFFFFRISLWLFQRQNLTASWIWLAPEKEKKIKKKVEKAFFLLFTFLTSFSLLVASYSIKSFLLVFFVFFSLSRRKNANIDICPKALKLVNIKLEIYGKNFQDFLPEFLRVFSFII